MCKRDSKKLFEKTFVARPYEDVFFFFFFFCRSEPGEEPGARRVGSKDGGGEGDVPDVVSIREEKKHPYYSLLRGKRLQFEKAAREIRRKLSRGESRARVGSGGIRTTLHAGRGKGQKKGGKLV